MEAETLEVVTLRLYAQVGAASTTVHALPQSGVPACREGAHPGTPLTTRIYSPAGAGGAL